MPVTATQHVFDMAYTSAQSSPLPDARANEHVFVRSVVSERVKLNPYELHSQFRDVLLDRLRHSVEGKCTRYGYIRKNSVRLRKVSTGQIEGSTLNGDIIFTVTYECDVINPVVGTVVRGRVTNVNKFGVLVHCGILTDGNHERVIDVIISKQGATSMTKGANVEAVQVGDSVDAEILCRRIELNDNMVHTIGRLVAHNNPSPSVALPFGASKKTSASTSGATSDTRARAIDDLAIGNDEPVHSEDDDDEADGDLEGDAEAKADAEDAPGENDDEEDGVEVEDDDDDDDVDRDGIEADADEDTEADVDADDDIEANVDAESYVDADDDIEADSDGEDDAPSSSRNSTKPKRKNSKPKPGAKTKTKTGTNTNTNTGSTPSSVPSKQKRPTKPQGVVTADKKKQNQKQKQKKNTSGGGGDTGFFDSGPDEGATSSVCTNVGASSDSDCAGTARGGGGLPRCLVNKKTKKTSARATPDPYSSGSD